MIITIGYWNIHGTRDKLEDEHVRDWFSQHDIVVLTETKTQAQPSIPGFVAVNHSKCRRGGIAILFKRKLYPYVTAIDVQDEGVIWYELTVIPGVKFCAMYNEPTDSSYFRPETLASISAHLSTGKLCVLGGDINAKLGCTVKELIGGDVRDYNVVDEGKNDNGKTLLSICKDSNLVIANNLVSSCRTLGGALSFRKKQRWVSELDLCVISRDLVHSVVNVNVDQDFRFPSDHAPVSVTLDFSKSLNNAGWAELVERSAILGSYPEPPATAHRKSIRYRHFDHQHFRQAISEVVPPLVTSADGVAELALLTDTVYQCCEMSITKPSEPEYSRPCKPKTRWKRILAENDSKLLWQGIDWNGEYKETESVERPTEAAFQDHMERLLNPEGVEPLDVDLSEQVYVPALDQPFTIEEVQQVIGKQIKPDKGCGPDGISPGALKLLPISWLLVLLTILNTLFQSSSYPVSWATSKLIMLFKKGSRMVCGNYRGISIIDALAKLFDYLLNNRLCMWIKPDREQAGAQPGRGCIEHVVTLRLLFDYSVRKKKPLYVAFIDFSKAYDRVPRRYMLELLKQLGCGAVMLAALRSMYRLTQFVLGTTVILATLGVKQGSPTSCFLFTLFVDELVKLVKDRSDYDGFLQWLHLLVLMDDTALVSTSRQGLIKKLNLLTEWCDRSGMVINEDKTEFMVIAPSSPQEDRKPIVVTTVSGQIVVKHCDSYTYLGAIFTSDGKVASTLMHHVTSRTKAMNKLIIFLDRNRGIPFFVKKKVLDACFSTSLLYGCEAWLGVKPSPEIKAFYMKAIKLLLGVRQSTHNDICLMEAGYPSLEAVIRSRQQVFFQKMIREREGIDRDPLMFAIKLTHDSNNFMSKYIRGLETAGDIIGDDVRRRSGVICADRKTRATKYRDMNPGLSIHSVYSNDSLLDDDLRICFTRFRVSSHRLRIETGRWSRTPSEQRLCQCGASVESEAHVLVECPLVQPIREKYELENIDFHRFVTTDKTEKELKLLRDILAFYE